VKKSEPPSDEEFNQMLDWLDPDRERAGAKFLEIGTRVTKILVRRQCYAAEELWDETANRVCHRVKEVAPTYVGDPALYFYGVLRNVYREWLHDVHLFSNPEPVYTPDSNEHNDDDDLVDDCLDECLKTLDPADREMILEYFANSGQAKIEGRKKLAARFGITLNTLRMKVHRINVRLRKCINDCLDALNKK